MTAKNLVSGTLADDITTSTTNILVHIADNISAQGITDFFPTTPFYITIMPKSPAIGVSNHLDSEIIKITNVGHDQVGNAALTGVRAQRDTTAKAFSTGDIVTVGVYAEDVVFLSEDGTTETCRKQLKDKDGNVIYPVVGILGTDDIANGAVTFEKTDLTTFPFGFNTFVVGRNGGSHSYTFKINRSTGSGTTLFIAGRVGMGGLYIANAWAEVIALTPISNMSVSATGGVDAGSDTVTVTFTNNNASASFPFVAITVR